MTSTRSLEETDEEADRAEQQEARLRAAVDIGEDELRRAMRRLQLQARARVDLGRILAPHMPVILAGAFVAGFWLGAGRPR